MGNPFYTDVINVFRVVYSSGIEWVLENPTNSLVWYIDQIVVIIGWATSCTSDITPAWWAVTGIRDNTSAHCR